MRTIRFRAIAIVAVLVIGSASVALARQRDPSAGATIQTFAADTSASASCVNPPGPCGALLSLPIDLNERSLLTITFSARGTVSQPTTAIVQTQITCDVDGTPCKPDGNGVQFLYPPFCCDTRSFTWIGRANQGSHKVTITWATLNQGTSFLTNRTLVVEAAKL